MSLSPKRQALIQAGMSLSLLESHIKNADRILSKKFNIAATPEVIPYYVKLLDSYKAALDHSMQSAQKAVKPYNRLPKNLVEKFAQTKKEKAMMKRRLTLCQKNALKSSSPLEDKSN